MSYDTAFDRLMGNEGGYSNNPHDPGGETNWGITWPVLLTAINMNVVPRTVSIQSLTRDQAKSIYKVLFWNVAGLDGLDPGIAFQVFDYAVNSGVQQAVRTLQKAVGVTSDGVIGPLTVAAVKSKSPAEVIMLYVAERLDYLRELQGWRYFGSGWAGRAAMNLRYGAQDIR